MDYKGGINRQTTESHRYNSSKGKPNNKMKKVDDRKMRIVEIWKECSHKFVYNPSDKSVGFADRRATDYKMNKFVHLPKAFDVIVRQNAIVEAYKAGTHDQGLLYLDSRMANRRTFPQWGKTLMGPICDTLGLEQGAVNSDRLYKLCNNSQLKEAQSSGLGLDIAGVPVAAIGQADDVALLTHSPFNLACLLHHTFQHCMRQHVCLVPEKTKLLAWTPSKLRNSTELLKLSCA